MIWINTDNWGWKDAVIRVIAVIIVIAVDLSLHSCVASRSNTEMVQTESEQITVEAGDVYSG